MPSPSTSKWPKPKNEDEFEDLSVEFLRLRWKDPHATRNGRRGQRQEGVDIVGHPAWLKGGIAGAQSKNTDKLNIATVVAEIAKAKTFVGGLDEFLILTSGDRDATLQAALRQHIKNNPVSFRVEIVFWDDIVADVSGDQELVAKHWKGFGAPVAPLADDEILRQMAMIFDRPAFTTPFSGESSLPAFKEAITDTIMSLNTGARRTRDGVELPRIASRHEVKSAKTKKRLAEVHEALTKLRSAYDGLLHSGDIQRCGCNVLDCPTLMLSEKATREMDQQRQRVLDLFRTTYPEFAVNVGRW